MKKELKNVRIVADNGEALLLSQKRYDCLLQTLDLLASGGGKRYPQNGRSQKSFTFRN